MQARNRIMTVEVMEVEHSDCAGMETTFERAGGTIAQPGPPHAATPARDAGLRDISILLNEIEEQLRLIEAAVQEDADVPALVDRIAGVIALEHRAGLLLLEHHLRECVLGTWRHEDQTTERLLLEVNAAIERFVRAVH